MVESHQKTDHPETDCLTGCLYVVATPIGNLDDMTFRAVRTLQTVNLIAAEDTRHTGKLLHHFHITTPQISYHDHNRRSRLPDLLTRLQQGKTLALVSDAGVPGISDPGLELVQACIHHAIPVIPIPGCSALTTALSAAGLATDRFVFEGFLPAKASDRQHRLTQLQHEPRTLVFYEAPHRLRQTLQDMATHFGEQRPIVLARELTKRHEEFWRGTLTNAIHHYTQQDPKGEFTLILGGSPPNPSPPPSEADLQAALLHLMQQGLSRSHASRQLAQTTDLPRRQLYQLALTLSPPTSDPDPSPDPTP